MEKVMLCLLLTGWFFIEECNCLFSDHIRGNGNTAAKLAESKKPTLDTTHELSYDAALIENSRGQISLINAQNNKTTSDVKEREVYKGVQYDLNDCLNIYHKKDKCKWLRETEHCKVTTSGRVVSYMEVIFCHMDEKYAYVSLIWMVLLLIVLVTIVILICTTFYVSAILAAATVLHLSENFAGITLVSVTSGFMDIFRGIQFVRTGETDVQYSYIMGGSIIMIVLLVGVVCINTPFRIQGPQFLRDCLFTLTAVVYSFVVLMLGHVTFLGVAGFLFLYFLYLLLAVLQIVFHPEIAAEEAKVYKHSTVMTRLASTKSSQWLRTCQINSAFTSDCIPVFPHKSLYYGEMAVNVRSMSYMTELSQKLKPINARQWRFATPGVRFCMILQAPLVFVFTLFIPVVDFSKSANGWIKPLNVLQVMFTPIICIFLHGSWNREVFPGVPLYLCIGLISLVFGVFIMFTAPRFTPPAYHFMFAGIAVAVSLLIMSVVIAEIMAILGTIGVLLHITPATLGCTILAWGNCLGDFFTVVTLTQKGYFRMGFAACYGSALFNICLGLGIGFFIGCIREGEVKVDPGILGPNIVLYMVCGLISCLVMLPVMGFQARKSYGFYLLVLYILFILRIILSELKLLHPLFSRNKILVTFVNGTTVWEEPIEKST